jgi:hypothetical protein
MTWAYGESGKIWCVWVGEQGDRLGSCHSPAPVLTAPLVPGLVSERSPLGLYFVCHIWGRQDLVQPCAPLLASGRHRSLSHHRPLCPPGLD